MRFEFDQSHQLLAFEIHRSSERRAWSPTALGTQAGFAEDERHLVLDKISFNQISTIPCESETLLQSSRSRAMMRFVTRQQLESAVASGNPFALRMADGREYSVPHRDYISLPPRGSYVIVYDDNGHFTVLPLLTMTGLQSNVT